MSEDWVGLRSCSGGRRLSDTERVAASYVLYLIVATVAKVVP